MSCGNNCKRHREPGHEEEASHDCGSRDVWIGREGRGTGTVESEMVTAIEVYFSTIGEVAALWVSKSVRIEGEEHDLVGLYEVEKWTEVDLWFQPTCQGQQRWEDGGDRW